jgi:probable rRNA maturation factor
MVRIRNFSGFEILEDKIKEIGNSVLEKEGKKDIAFNLVFVSSDRIKELNKTYREKDNPTDVLSFENKEEFVLPSSESKRELGEILICPEQVAINAKSLNIDFEEEICRLMIHGILHLLGYDHEKDEEEFFKKQEFYVDTLY